MYTHTQGNGTDVVLLHGWGMHGDIWFNIAAQLAKTFRVTTVDLPGHGRSQTEKSEHNFINLTNKVVDATPQPAVWIGWSLGGMIAMRAAIDHPELITKLVLIASTPKFVASGGWPHAMAPEVLESFAQDLEQDYRGTLLRFLSLQTRGSQQARQDMRQLRERLFCHGEPDIAALRIGLQLLRETNLTTEITRIRCPALLIMGDKDMLTPPGSGEKTVQLLADGRLQIIPGAGHAPFLSHPQQVIESITTFIHE
jgi:pimeloyl-[acyl-carrier protein] methyl ester esterase